MSTEKENIVTVQKVEGRVNYKKLIEEFGTEELDQTLLDRFQKATGKDLHPWLKRGIFFSHRDFGKFLSAYENGEPVFLYTGRGPSSDSMHIGHLIPFMFTKWLQDVFDCPLVIQLSDEEKYAFKKGTFQELYKMGFENAKDIISCGFNPEKTFIFSNRDYRINCPKYETFVSDLKINASVKDVAKVFGFTEDCNIGMYDWPFYQSAASFSQAFPHIFGGRPAYCLIPCAIDQDPYFRLGRDLASKMNLIKTTCIYCTFLPPLIGLDGGKMSSSIGKEATLYLNDEEEVLRSKISKYSKSGSRGNGTLEDHRRLGGDVENDIACQYLKYFEMDDKVLEGQYESFSKGEITCSEMKSKLADRLLPIFKNVSEKRKAVTDEELMEYYKVKPILLPQPKEKEKTESQVKAEEKLKLLKAEYLITYHNPIISDEDLVELRTRLEGVLCRVSLLYEQDKFYILISHVDSILSAEKVKQIGKSKGLKKLYFAKADTVKQILKSEGKYDISLFGLLYDEKRQVVKVMLDSKIESSQKVNFPILRKDAYVTIDYSVIGKFLLDLNYELEEINL